METCVTIKKRTQREHQRNIGLHSQVGSLRLQTGKQNFMVLYNGEYSSKEFSQLFEVFSIEYLAAHEGKEIKDTLCIHTYFKL